MGPHSEVPRLDTHQVVEGELQYKAALCEHLSEHRLAVMRDHGGVVAVEGDGSVVEGLLGMLHGVVQLRDTAIEYTPEVARQ